MSAAPVEARILDTVGEPGPKSILGGGEGSLVQVARRRKFLQPPAAPFDSLPWARSWEAWCCRSYDAASGCRCRSRRRRPSPRPSGWRSPFRAAAPATRRSTPCRCGPTWSCTSCPTTTRSASSGACSSTTRSASTARCSAAPPRSSSSARSRGPARPTALDHALVYAHWAWFLQPHAAAAWILWRHPRRFPRAATMICAVFDLGLVGYFAGADRPALVGGGAGPASRVCGGSWSRSGERVWGRLWSPLYGFLGGNPLAAMPSLHFATS